MENNAVPDTADAPVPPRRDPFPAALFANLAGLTPDQIGATAQRVWATAKTESGRTAKPEILEVCKIREAQAVAVIATLRGTVLIGWEPDAKEVLIRCDPEWDTYQRLKRKFGDR
jgi:hypothetical protein